MTQHPIHHTTDQAVLNEIGKLVEEEKKGLVSWTGQALNEEAGLQRWVGALQIALGTVVVAANTRARNRNKRARRNDIQIPPGTTDPHSLTRLRPG